MDLDNLINNVKNFFLSQFGSAIDSSSTILEFEPLGHMISPDDFKNNGIFDKNIAMEQLSMISDVVPEISDVFIPDGFNSISGTYSGLVGFMQFADTHIHADDISPYLASLNNIKSKALQIIDESSRASYINPSDKFFPCTSNPDRWYDETAPIWNHKTFVFSEVENKPAQGDTKPDMKNQLNLRWKLNLNADNISQCSVAKKIMPDFSMIRRINLPVNRPIIDKPVTGNSVTSPGQDISLKRVQKTMLSKGVSTQSQLTGTIQSKLDSGIKSQPPLLLINKASYSTIRSGIPLQEAIKLNRVLGASETSETKPVDSTDFSMEFDYVLVDIKRDWLYSEVFNNASLWFALTKKSGDYSSGEKLCTNSGLLKCIPHAMIVIKNLKLSAKWSDEDKASAGSAYGLGCFNITDSSFEQNTLTAPGIQIIGWICQVTPKIPLYDDPNIIN